MTPEMKQELIRKVDQIHTALVGYDGKNGILSEVRAHENRIETLERWARLSLGLLDARVWAAH